MVTGTCKPSYVVTAINMRIKYFDSNVEQNVSFLLAHVSFGKGK